MANIGTAYAIKSYTVSAPGFTIVEAPIDCNTFSVKPEGGAVTIFTDVNDPGELIPDGSQEVMMQAAQVRPRFAVGAKMFGLKVASGTVLVKVKFLL